MIDYDSVYLPALKGQPDFIRGLKGYQHPNRTNNANANEKLDYFSEIIIYTSIVGVAENPDFVNKYKLEDSEEMLFSPEDFIDIENSEIFKDLLSLKGVFPHLLQILSDYLKESDINKLQPFDLLMERYYKHPQILSFEIDGIPTVAIDKEVDLLWNIDNASELYLNDESLVVYQKRKKISFSSLGKKSIELVAVNGIFKAKETLIIDVVDSAIIVFKSDKIKLKRGKHENAILQWSIENALSAVIIYYYCPLNVAIAIPTL